MERKNVAFAGLTAAGKTTHAKLLAEDLGYRYVSATEILLDVIGIDLPPERIWFTHSKEIEKARVGDAADWELERRLKDLAASEEGIVFDTWALAWIADTPLARIWIESSPESRVRKCYVSQDQSRPLGIQECAQVVERKDEDTRQNFLRRHRFDLRADRARYDVEICNSHLIPVADEATASSGIRHFRPILAEVVDSLLRVGRVEPQIVNRYPSELDPEVWRALV